MISRQPSHLWEGEGQRQGSVGENTSFGFSMLEEDGKDFLAVALGRLGPVVDSKKPEDKEKNGGDGEANNGSRTAQSAWRWSSRPVEASRVHAAIEEDSHFVVEEINAVG